MNTKVISEITIAYNEDTEWDIVGTIPTKKEWEDIEESLKPEVMAVNNGIGYYEYGSICGNDSRYEPEVQDEGETLKLKIKVAGNMLDWTPEEVVHEVIDSQDYIPHTYTWSTPNDEVSCEFELEAIKTHYSSDEKMVIAEIGYCEA